MTTVMTKVTMNQMKVVLKMTTQQPTGTATHQPSAKKDPTGAVRKSLPYLPAVLDPMQQAVATPAI